MTRPTYAAFAAITMALGLTVHRSGGALSSDARDIAGDALWAMMMTWLVSVARPHASLPTRAAVALGICAAVEASQLVHTPMLDAIRATTPGHLVLGNGFDARDLLAYAVGVLGAVALERGWRRRAKA